MRPVRFSLPLFSALACALLLIAIALGAASSACAAQPVTLAAAPASAWYAICIAVFLLAGFVKGVVGLGLPTISMALLALTMSPAEAAALLIVPSLVTNVLQLAPWRTLPAMLRRLGGMQVGICLGTWAGALLLGAPAGAWAALSLGIVLIAYAAWNFSAARATVAPAAQAWAGPLTGAVTGLVTAATGVFVVPAVPYLQALQLSREQLIQAMGLCFTVSTLALAGGLVLNGSYSVAAAGQSVLMLVPALIGMAVGARVRQRLSQQLFRRCFMAALVALGAYMVVAELVAR